MIKCGTTRFSWSWVKKRRINVFECILIHFVYFIKNDRINCILFQTTTYLHVVFTDFL